MTSDDMKVSKGLEFPVTALPGVGHMPVAGEDEQEAARAFYVAATRATQGLVIGVGEDGRQEVEKPVCQTSEKSAIEFVAGHRKGEIDGK
jgi:superfamily I DNA/RNA helicase